MRLTFLLKLYYSTTNDKCEGQMRPLQVKKYTKLHFRETLISSNNNYIDRFCCIWDTETPIWNHAFDRLLHLPWYPWALLQNLALKLANQRAAHSLTHSLKILHGWEKSIFHLKLLMHISCFSGLNHLRNTFWCMPQVIDTHRPNTYLWNAIVCNKTTFNCMQYERTSTCNPFTVTKLPYEFALATV